MSRLREQICALSLSKRDIVPFDGLRAHSLTRNPSPAWVWAG
jgi:hypothetical protein